MTKSAKTSGRPTLAPRNRVALFSDAASEAQLQALLRQTQRTATIIELMGIGAEINSTRLRGHINRLLRAANMPVAPPRGVPRSAEAQSFLSSRADRVDAAMLIAIHFGPRGPGEFSESDVDLSATLNKMLESFSRYKDLRYPLSEPTFDFESWVALLRGIRSRVVEIHHCRECGSMHPVRADELSTPSCPICNLLDLDMPALRRRMEQRIARRRAMRDALKPSEMRG